MFLIKVRILISMCTWFEDDISLQRLLSNPDINDDIHAQNTERECEETVLTNKCLLGEIDKNYLTLLLH